MAVNPYTPDYKVLNYEIMAGEVKGLGTLLIDAEINFELNKIPTAKFVFFASNLDNAGKELLESDELELNGELTFDITTDKGKKTLFKGFIKSIEKKTLPNQNLIKVECKDECYKMTFTGTEAETNELTFDDHLEAAAGSLTVDSSLTGQEWGQEKITMNSSVTPWDFILSYLDSVGVMVAARNSELKGIDITQSQSEKYFAETGINIFAFSGKADLSKKIKKVSIDYWDPASQSVQKTEAEQEADYENNKIVRLNENRFSQGTITLMANATLKKSDLLHIYGKVLTFGNLEAIAGDYIICNKVHAQIDNKVLLITGERHIIENGTWKTEYTFGLEKGNAFADMADQQAQKPQAQIGQANLTGGLLIGTVVQLEEDPGNEFRIKVRIPALAENGEGVWARLGTLSGAAEMGSFFIPNVDDEVILGCLGNNPDNPIILGSLYSSAHTPPYPITADNFIKGFVTKEQTKIVLDDEKKSIELSTAQGNKLTISDELKGIVLEDENKNKISMNDNGITIESAKDVIIKAKGNFKAEASAFQLKASGNFEMKGATIKLN